MAEYAALVAQVDATSAAAAKIALLEYAEAAGAAETATAALQRVSGKGATSGTFAAAARELQQYQTAQQGASQATKAAEAALKSQRDQARLNVQAAVELARATRELERQEAQAARTAEMHAKRIADIERAMSPAAAITVTLAQRVKTLDAAFAAGAVTEAKYASLKQQVTDAAGNAQAQLARYATANDGATRSMRGATLAGLDLSRQFADIGVTAAMGMSPLLILVQQGPQVADRLALMRMEGVTLGAALKSMAASAAGLLVTIGPIAAAVGAVVGVFVLMSQEAKRAQEALDAAGESLKRVQDDARDLTRMATSLATATTDTASAADRAADAYERQALQAAFLAGKLRELNAVQLIGEIDASEKRLKKLADVNGDRGLLATFRTSPNEGYTNARNALLKELGFTYMGDATGQSRAPDDVITQARRNPMAFSPDVRKALNAFNRAEVKRTAQDSAYEAERQYLARLYAEANPANAQQPTLLEEVEITAPRRRGGGARARFDQSDQAIEQATRAELQARMALTANIAEVARLKLQEVDAELAIQKERTARSLHEKSITGAAAATVNALNEQAAASKRTAVERERVAALSQQELAFRGSINADLDRAGQAQAALARDASEANRIAAASLARRQALETAALAEDQRAAVERGQITGWKALERALAQKIAQEAERTLAAEEARRRLVVETADAQRSELEVRGAALEAQQMLMRSDYARSAVGQELLQIEQSIARLEAQRAIDLTRQGSRDRSIAEQRYSALLRVQEAERELAERDVRLANAITEAANAVYGFKSAIRRHDWARVFDSFVGGLETILTSFRLNGLGGGLMAAGSAAGALIGGRTGNAIGTGLGIAGLGMAAGSWLGGGALAAGVANGIVGLGGSAALAGGIGSALMGPIAAALGPIGLAAGALYAAAKIFNIGGKPSNQGAGYDLVTGAISGKSRDSETESAARTAGDAIKGIQDAIKAAGIGLTDSITGLVIGTRDQTQIYTASGKTLRSAVGDSGAAVDTAMRALLESADYVSEAQEKLVKSALAAGKGFDAVQEILAKYETAQGISAGIADEILRLKDPEAYDVKAVRDDIEAQRKAYAQLTADGYLTADQLAKINEQLATLEGLKLDEVFARYAETAAAIPTPAVNDNTPETLSAVAQSAEQMLRDAYENFAQAKRAEIDALRQSAEGLKAFRRELDFGSIAGRDPVSQYEAVKREFDRLSALDAANPERLANLQGVSQAFIEASRAVSPTQLAFDRDLQAVRRATEASEKAATTQADIAQAALDAQTAAVDQLITLNATAVTIAQGIAALAIARANAAAGGANDNIDVTRYLALNPDLVQNWQEGGILRQAGATLEEAALAHWMLQGKGEGRKFATGGSFDVQGPRSGDQVPVNLWANGDETINVSRSDNMERVAKALERQNALLEEQIRLLGKGNVNTRQSADVLSRVSPDGDALKVAS